jgi:hypothetical protein
MKQSIHKQSEEAELRKMTSYLSVVAALWSDIYIMQLILVIVQIIMISENRIEVRDTL